VWDQVQVEHCEGGCASGTAKNPDAAVGLPLRGVCLAVEVRVVPSLRNG
jgi:hypothetical protein